MNAQSWVDLKQDADTGIEVIRAHFEGHAYDPHWHDSYLIGFCIIASAALVAGLWQLREGFRLRRGAAVG